MKSLAARRLAVRSGPRALVGRVATVRAVPAPVGQVQLDGALWRARMWDLERKACRWPRAAPSSSSRSTASPLLSDRPRNGRCIEMTAVLVGSGGPRRAGGVARGRVGSRAARVRARRGVPLRPPRRPEGPGPGAAGADRRSHGAGDAAHDHAHDSAAGRDHARQRARPRGRRRVLPRRGRGRVGGRHRGLPAGDLRDREDHAALGARQGGARHVALRARAPQRGSAAHHRRADRAVGDQGASRSRSRTSGSRRRCSARWRARRRPSATAARR